MAVTPYCTSTHVESLAGGDFVVWMTDDENDGGRTASHVADAIERASDRANQYLLTRYTVAQALQSTWLKWVVAQLAVCDLARRRNNPTPSSAYAECESYLEDLKEIRDGKALLPGDTGPIPSRFDPRPTVSNLTVDRRYPRGTVRVVESTSTGGQPPEGVKRLSAPDITGH